MTHEARGQVNRLVAAGFAAHNTISHSSTAELEARPVRPSLVCARSLTRPGSLGGKTRSFSQRSGTELDQRNLFLGGTPRPT